jgi:hypothetical protein
MVPSLDAWVTLRRTLPQDEMAIDQARWTTLVAVGGGATVRRIADELCLAELPVSRAVKELLEVGLVDLAETPPAGAVTQITPALEATPAPAAASARPLFADPDEPAPPRTARGRRARSSAPAEPDVFVPLELPGSGPAPSYDGPVEEGVEPAEEAVVDDLAAAFPGLANRATPSTVDVDDEDLAKQLATLSPRAASAIRAAAEASTDEERDAALEEIDDADQPLNRGLLLKFLSSVKS